MISTGSRATCLQTPGRLEQEKGEKTVGVINIHEAGGVGGGKEGVTT